MTISILKLTSQVDLGYCPARIIASNLSVGDCPTRDDRASLGFGSLKKTIFYFTAQRPCARTRRIYETLIEPAESLARRNSRHASCLVVRLCAARGGPTSRTACGIRGAKTRGVKTDAHLATAANHRAGTARHSQCRSQ